jgi:hypothetical protein
MRMSVRRSYLSLLTGGAGESLSGGAPGADGTVGRLGVR